MEMLQTVKCSGSRNKTETRTSMKVGKLSQTVWKRSVLKQLHTKREESLLKISAAEPCCAYQIETDGIPVTASYSVTGKSAQIGLYALAGAVNHLISRGAEPIGIRVSVLFPESAQESDVKALTGVLETGCAQMGMELAGIQAEVNPAVSLTWIQAEAFGSFTRENEETAPQIRQPKHICAGQDIILCGYIGLEGTLRILDEREEQLRERFVPAFLHQTKALVPEMIKLETLRILNKAERAGKVQVSAIQQIGSGGIFAALWDAAEASGTGLAVDMKKISVRQETVEICEYYHLNPYQMTSAGSFLIFTETGDEVIKILEAAGVRAVRLGSATAENARVITSGSEQRYLDRPAPDELALWRKKELEEL